MLSKLHQDCEDCQEELKIIVTESPTAAKLAAPVLHRAHEYFMKNDVAQALELYQLGLTVAKTAVDCSSPMPSCTETAESNFTPVVLKRKIRFADVIGLKPIKQLLSTEFILPVRNPNLLLKPLSGVLGVLLYGPPGVGKTFLAEAVANEAEVPFFNVILSDLDSKWRGEAEKLASELFRTLRKHRYSVVFLDEVESLMGTRAEGDSMAKFKSVLLTEIDGIESKNSDSFILLLAATNCPDTLDKAFSSRFCHQLLVRPPSDNERVSIISGACKRSYNLEITSRSYAELKQYTKNYSSRDVAKALDSLNVKPLLKIAQADHFKAVSTGLYCICDRNDVEGFSASASELGFENIVRPELTEEDVLDHFRCTQVRKPREDLARFENFAHQVGRTAVPAHARQQPSLLLKCLISIFTCLGGRQ